jgi:hypothetical protein
MTTPEDDTTREDGAPDERPDPSVPAGSTQEPARAPTPLSASPADEGTGRPRIVSAELDVDQRSSAIIRVGLQRGRLETAAETEAVGEEMVVLRRAAEATLEALHDMLGLPGHFDLVGVKRILAFDSPVILVGLRIATGRPRTLIGCVPAGDNLTRAVAEAVLNATNRLVEALPNAQTEGES